MHYEFLDSPKRKIDETLMITDLFVVEGQPFDCVICDLDGYHGSIVNHKSEKYYLILEGQATVWVESEEYNAKTGDLVHIPKEKVHSIEGRVRFACISTPIFDWRTEDKVD